MTRFLRFLLSISIVVFSCILLTGCLSSPPDAESVDARFQNNYEDIQIVVDFVIDSEYQDIHINTTDGMMWADFETVEISNEEVNSAINRLLGRSFWGDRQYLAIYKSGHTISLPQWSGPQDNGCGVACYITEVMLPRIEYCTELTPLSQTGWYYYVDDYNAWRVGKRP